MKKLQRKLCGILALVMVLTSFNPATVSATELPATDDTMVEGIQNADSDIISAENGLEVETAENTATSVSANEVDQNESGEVYEEPVSALMGSDDMYIITFDSNGGSEVDSVSILKKTDSSANTYSEGFNDGKFPVPTKKDGQAKFLGWYTEKTGGVKVSESDSISLGVDSEGKAILVQTLYAHWTEPYEIKFDTLGGEPKDSIYLDSTNPENTKFGTITDPVHSDTDFTFVGWYTDKNNRKGSLLDKDTLATTAHGMTNAGDTVTLYAWWEGPYTVNFYDGDRKIATKKLYKEEKAEDTLISGVTDKTTRATLEIYFNVDSIPELQDIESFAKKDENDVRDFLMWFSDSSLTRPVNKYTRAVDARDGDSEVINLYAFWDEPYTLVFHMEEDSRNTSSGTTTVENIKVKIRRRVSKYYGSSNADLDFLGGVVNGGEFPEPIKLNKDLLGWYRTDSYGPVTKDDGSELVTQVNKGDSISYLSVEAGATIHLYPKYTEQTICSTYATVYQYSYPIYTNNVITSMYREPEYDLNDEEYSKDNPKAVIPGAKLKLESENNSITGYEIRYWFNDKASGDSNTYTDEIVLSQDVFDTYDTDEDGVICITAGLYKPGFKSTNKYYYFKLKDTSDSWGDNNSLLSEENRAGVAEADREQWGNNANNVPQTMWIATASIPALTYTGKALTIPNLRVYYHKSLLILNKDYKVSYKNNTNAGTATLTVTGVGSFEGTLSKEFTINPVSVNTEELVLTGNGAEWNKTTGRYEFHVNDNTTAKKKDIASVVWNAAFGDAKKKQTLAKNKDYEIIYSSESGAYTAKADTLGADVYAVTVRGKGNYSFTTSYYIAVDDNKKITDGLVFNESVIKKKVNYTGVAQNPFNDMSAWVKGTTYSYVHGCEESAYDGSDASIAYTYRFERDVKKKNNTTDISDHTEVGFVNVIITGVGAYYGTKTLSFEIAGNNITSSMTFASSMTTTYDYGHVRKLQTVVPTDAIIYKKGTAEQKILKGEMISAGNIASSGLSSAETYAKSVQFASDVDYAYAFKRDKVYTDDISSAGRITIEIIGVNKYTGTTTKAFKVKGITLPDVKNLAATYAWTGSPVKPLVPNASAADCTSATCIYTEANGVKIPLIGIEKSAFDSLSDSDRLYYDYTYTYYRKPKELGSATSVDDLTSAGKIYLDIEGVNKYSGKKTRNYTIKTVAINSVKFASSLTTARNYTGTQLDAVSLTPDALSYGGRTLTGISKASYESMTDEAKIGYDYVYTLRRDAKALGNGTDTSDITNIGKIYIDIEGVNGYSGKITKFYEIKSKYKQLSDGSIKYQYSNSIMYTGIFVEPSLVIKATKDNSGKTLVTEKTLEEGVDYTVTYKRNGKQVESSFDLINAGNITMVVTGKGEFAGTKTLSYTIKPYDLSKDTDNKIDVIWMNFIYEGDESATYYQKGGAVPKVAMKFGGIMYFEESNFTIKCSGNNVIRSRYDKNAPKITLQGKGNFTGSKSYAFTILKAPLEWAKTVAGEAIVDGNKTWAEATKPDINIYNYNGKALSKGTDFDSNFTYYYVEDTFVSAIVNGKKVENQVRMAGSEVEVNDIVLPNTILIAKISAKSDSEFYTGSTQVRVRCSSASINSATVIIPEQPYDGHPVELAKSDIIVKVKVNGKDVYLSESDYNITDYSNNYKVGTAKITITGAGNYSGTKTQSFQIKKRNLSKYNVVYTFSKSDINSDGTLSVTGNMTAQKLSTGTKVAKCTLKKNGYKFKYWASDAGITIDDQGVFTVPTGAKKNGKLIQPGDTIYLRAVFEPIE